MVKNNLIAPVIGVCCLAACVMSCSGKYFAPEIGSVTEIRFLKISEDSVTLRAIVPAKNTNIVSMTLSHIQFAINSDKDMLGTAYHDTECRLPSDSTVLLDFNISVSTSKAAELFTNARSSIALIVKGHADACVLGIGVPGNFELPFEFKLDESLERALSSQAGEEVLISITSASLESIGLNESDIAINFSITNPLDIPITLLGYSAKIYINGKYTGEGRMAGHLVLEKKARGVEGQFKFRADNVASLSAAVGALFSGRTQYRTEGLLNFQILSQKISIPYCAQGNILP